MNVYDSSCALTPFGIYIHWPFCKSKCPYCDFFSKVGKQENQDELIAQYLDDLDYYADLTSDRTVTSVFFGGGTPSLIKPQNISRLLERVSARWTIAPDIEISLEANPNTAAPTLFHDLRNAGINRLSLGIQALNDKDLRFLGRTHNVAEALNAASEITRIFDNHSLDLIYARPDQTLQEWEQELEQAVALGFKHLSLYQLTIEPETVFAKKGIRPLDEENALALYQFTNAFFQNSGYSRYEVSNYSRPNHQCRHNLLYWQGYDYLGVGSGAHGRLKINDSIYALTHRRQWEKLNAVERAEELIIMGLRLTQGIDKAHFQQACGLSFDSFINPSACRDFAAQGLLLDTQRYLCISEKGFPLLNYLIVKLCDNGL